MSHNRTKAESQKSTNSDRRPRPFKKSGKPSQPSGARQPGAKFRPKGPKRNVKPTFGRLPPNPPVLRKLLKHHEAIASQICRIKRGSRTEAGPVNLKTLVQDYAADIYELWAGFTKERQDINRYLQDPKRGAAAYFLGFHPSNLARSMITWQRLLARNPQLIDRLRASEEPITIVDLGCGTGALSQCLIAILIDGGIPPERIQVHGVDRVGAFLDVFRLAHGCYLKPEQIRGTKLDLYKLDLNRLEAESKGVTIYALGYMVNEIAKNRRLAERFDGFLQGASGSDKPVMTWIMEPGNEHPARALMELRDGLMLAGGKPLYPCPSSHACPLLSSGRDWCYSEFTWERPPFVAYLDQRLAIDRQRLAAASLVVASPGMIALLGVNQAKQKASEPIVVGRPTDKNSRGPSYSKPFRYLMCRPNGEIAFQPGQRGVPLSLRGMPRLR